DCRRAGQRPAPPLDRRLHDGAGGAPGVPHQPEPAAVRLRHVRLGRARAVELRHLYARARRRSRAAGLAEHGAPGRPRVLRCLRGGDRARGRHPDHAGAVVSEVLPRLSVLLLTEDSGAQADETLRTLVVKLLGRIAPGAVTRDDAQTWEPASPEARAVTRGNGWKNPRRPELVRFRQYIA